MKRTAPSTYQSTATSPYNTPLQERNIMTAWLVFLHYVQYVRLMSHEASRVALYDRCTEQMEKFDNSHKG